MALPHLHIFHPSLRLAPHLPVWLGSVEALLRNEVTWDGCDFHRLEFNDQAGFDVPTAVEMVTKYPGPVIVIQKVQMPLLSRFQQKVSRKVSVYAILASSEEDIWKACEAAFKGFNDGEPRISARELIAYLILRKLERRGHWGGESLNKNYLGIDDLPNGGFPKECANSKEILEVADVLCNAGLIRRKLGDGIQKYALAEKALVQPILDSKTFESCGSWPKLQKYFARGTSLVPAALLGYNETS
ncbi:MAG: hypothetical protein WD875_16730 [Pirellulales bacterium]